MYVFVYARTCFLEIHSMLKHASTIMHVQFMYYRMHSAAEKSVPSPFHGKNVSNLANNELSPYRKFSQISRKIVQT
jgi:hypothetical protein